MLVPIAALVAFAVGLSMVLGGSIPPPGSVLTGPTLHGYVLDTDAAILPNAAGELQDGHGLYTNADSFYSASLPRSPEGCHAIMVVYLSSDLPDFGQPGEKGFAIEFAGFSLVGTKVKFRNPQNGTMQENIIERPEGIYDIIRATRIRTVDLEEVRAAGSPPWLKGQACRAPSES